MNKNVLQQLISFNTISSQSNLELINYAKNVFKKSGYKIKIVKGNNKANLFAYRGKISDKRIILSAHTDTVDATEFWTKKPFKLSEDKEKYYGLGICDMKVFIAIMLDLSEKYQNKNLGFLLTFDEETDFSGALLIDNKIIKRSDIIIIGEPTNNKFIKGNKGCTVYDATIYGRGGHSSEPQKGISAIIESVKFISEFQKEFDKISKQCINNNYINPYPTLNFGKITGGEAINMIAQKTNISFEIRTNGTKCFNLAEKILNKIQSKLKAKAKLKKVMELSNYEMPALLIKKLNNIKIPLSKGLSYATEANIFIKFCSNIIVFGPGDLSMAHQNDESIKIKSISNYENDLNKLLKIIR